MLFPSAQLQVLLRILVLHLVFFPLLPAGATPYRLDLYGSLQPTRNQTRAEVAEVSFSNRRIEKYTAAQKTQNQRGAQKSRRSILSRTALQAFQEYLAAMQLDCPNANTESELVCCLGQSKIEIDMLTRLSIWQAAKLSDRLNLKRLERKLYETNDYRINDPLNQRIYTQYLELLKKSGSSDASNLALKYPHIKNAMSDLWRVRILAGKISEKKLYIYLIRASRDTNAWWIEKAILSELRKHQSRRLSGSYKSQLHDYRDLTTFSQFMKASELSALKSRLSVQNLITTSNRYRLKDDGIFLIRSSQAAGLPKLANKGYTILSQEPDILYDWSVLLKQKGNWGLIRKVMQPLKHTLVNHPQLWDIYLESLEKSGLSTLYFTELISYLKKYPAHFDEQDRLISFLIGSNPDKYHYAADAYWRKAYQGLAHHTDSGRFLYWLKKYFIHKNNTTGARRLDEHIYALAPGSFYVGAWWDQNQNQDRNYIAMWNQIDNRRDFHKWLSRYGGNQKAMRYMSRQSHTKWLDPQAVQLDQELSSGKYAVSKQLLLIYQFGHFKLGLESLLAAYPLTKNREQRYARLAWIGTQTGNLNYSVYYTRQFLRERGISEDPYGMPKQLLGTLYPRPWNKEVRLYSRKYKIEPEAVYAIMRQESLFRDDAVSRSGARGLMQIMPRTGQWLAGKLGLKKYDLADPNTNIMMGTRFFADLNRSYDDFRWAAIAYNGGPGNLRKWKKKYYRGDLYHFLEHLPKAESRNYCRITYQNYMHYKAYSLLYM